MGVQPTTKSYLHSEAPLRKTKLPFANGYQVEIASGLGLAAYVHYSQSRILSGADMCRPVHAASISELIFAAVPLCLEGLVSLVLASILALTLFIPPLPGVP